ncbi:MAG: class I SAM-dependent methyltransferase [Oscillospiraceae bacterium]|nr:class I SAM-dependent methyltransferase [Oscillospiraceae bacterium]
MRDSEGFDQWADKYDDHVREGEREGGYPFAGYGEVHERIFRRVTAKKNAAVLDLGFGTGTLTARLYDAGCEVYGQDFSKKMLEAAAAKMPGAKLYLGDLKDGLAGPLRGLTFDFIIATYALHHLTDPQKAALLRELRGRLREGGAILVGDVSFPDAAAREACRIAAGDEWDTDEYYAAFDGLARELPGLRFERVSLCAGIMTLGK